MNPSLDQKRKKARNIRLPLVATLLQRGHSYRTIREQVLKTFPNQETYSTSTVHADIKYLLAEWQQHRIHDIDTLVTLELERIDEAMRELWTAWDRSKELQRQTTKRQKGLKAGKAVLITEVEESDRTETTPGDVSYIVEIRRQLQERRRLLGLYAPDKVEISDPVNIDALSDEEKADVLKILRKLE